MKFGIFYELQSPRPWEIDTDLNLYQNALSQVELADKLKSSVLLLKTGAVKTTTKAAKGSDELVSALVNLGYRAAEAERAAENAREAQPDADLGTLVRLALQTLMAKPGMSRG